MEDYHFIKESLCEQILMKMMVMVLAVTMAMIQYRCTFFESVKRTLLNTATDKPNTVQ